MPANYPNLFLAGRTSTNFDSRRVRGVRTYGTASALDGLTAYLAALAAIQSYDLTTCPWGSVYRIDLSEYETVEGNYPFSGLIGGNSTEYTSFTVHTLISPGAVYYGAPWPYEGPPTYLLTGLTVGQTVYWVKGANDVSCGSLTETGYFTATDTSVLLTGLDWNETGHDGPYTNSCTVTCAPQEADDFVFNLIRLQVLAPPPVKVMWNYDWIAHDSLANDQYDPQSGVSNAKIFSAGSQLVELPCFTPAIVNTFEPPWNLPQCEVSGFYSLSLYDGRLLSNAAVTYDASGNYNVPGTFPPGTQLWWINPGSAAGNYGASSSGAGGTGRGIYSGSFTVGSSGTVTMTGAANGAITAYLLGPDRLPLPLGQTYDDSGNYVINGLPQAISDLISGATPALTLYWRPGVNDATCVGATTISAAGPVQANGATLTLTGTPGAQITCLLLATGIT